MKITDGEIRFENSDINFVSKVGLFEAWEMVKSFRKKCDLPFIYDTYQLAEFLRIDRSWLFKLTKTVDSHYTYTTIKKKNGGGRKLYKPSGELKAVQRSVLERLLNKHEISPYATAYKKGGKLIDNASPHCKKKYLLKMDLENFFDSITFKQVYSSVFNTNFYPKQVGVMLTTLCLRNDTLPQGAPTSPAISNIVMKNFDEIFGSWCNKNSFSYTRYCDDITVSGDTPLYVAFVKAKSLLSEMGFKLNEKKTRFVKNSDCQLVTGLAVNERARIPAEYRKALRQDVYYTLRFGADSAMKRSKNFVYKPDESVDRAVRRYKNTLLGKIRYVLQIEPDNLYFAQVLLKLEGLCEIKDLWHIRSKHNNNPD